jgi:hypothetical protein
MRESKCSGEAGLPTTLFLIFLVLKLTDTISWSWWWVAAPLWISSIIALVIFAVVFIIEVSRK